MEMVKQFEIYIIDLGKTIGTEIRKTRPCVVVSPNDMNRWLSTAIIAPMTSTKRNYPTRINITFQGREGQIALEQIRTVDNKRLVRKIGVFTNEINSSIINVLTQIFS